MIRNGPAAIVMASLKIRNRDSTHHEISMSRSSKRRSRGFLQERQWWKKNNKTALPGWQYLPRMPKIIPGE
jgi:hypothetical protein